MKRYTSYNLDPAPGTTQTGPRSTRHAPVSNQRGEHLGEVVSSHHDGRPPDHVLLDPVLPDGDPLGVVADVHQRPNHRLIVHSHLRHERGGG